MIPAPSGREMADMAVQQGAIDMAQGVVHTLPPSIFKETLESIWERRRAHVYASPAGFEGYRTALLKLLQEENSKLELENVMGAHGVTGGLLAALRVAGRAQDKVALCEPFYPAHEWAIQSLNMVPQYVPWADDLSLDIDSLAEQLDGCKAMILANPANPTGTVLAHEELLAVYDMCRQKEVLLIMDEVYRDFIWEGEYFSLLATTKDLEGLVILRSFSKNLALAGWRVGYALAQAPRLREMIHFHDAVYVGAPAAPQMVMAELLRNHNETLNNFISQLTNEYSQRRMEVSQAFREIGMEPILKQGAYYMMVRHNRGGDMQAMRELLDKGVAVAPGLPFYRAETPDTGYLRVHFALSENDSRLMRERLGV